MLKPSATSAPSVDIRAMTPADIPAVCDMAGRIWREHYVPEIVTAEQIEYMLPRLYSAEVIERNIRERKQQFWLIHYNGALAGYSAVEPQGKDTWFIDKLYIEMKLQRQGLGKTMLDHIVAQHRPKTLRLRVNRKNYKALNFYFRHHFAIESLDNLDIGSGFFMDDFIMKKVL